MKNSSVASIVAATVSAGGAFGGYMYFKPKDLSSYLQWKGYELAKGKDEPLWKAIYEDNRDTFLSDFGEVKQGETNKWRVIRDYCLRAFKKLDYSPEIEKAVKWCLNEVKTVRGQLVREGKGLDNLMKNPKQYQVATAVQGNEKFWSLLEIPNGTFEQKTEAYQAWCDKSLKAKPTKGLVENVNTFCNKKEYANFLQKLSFDKLTRMKDKEIEDKIDKDFKDFKRTSKSNVLDTIAKEDKELEKIITADGNNDLGSDFKNNFKKAYKKYCQLYDKKEFEKDNYANLYSKYKTICAKRDGSKN